MSWPVVKLGDICDLFNGYAFKSADYMDESNTLSCRMSNIRPGGKFDIEYNARYLPDDFVEKYEQFLLKDGDVVIAMTDLADSPKILGVPTIIKTNGRKILLNQRVGKLIIKERNKVHFPYLQIALNSSKVRSIYKRFAGGGLQINLGKADLLSVEIPLPPLAEQQKIASILDAADSLRQKDHQLIEKYTALSQSLFLEMFGDPETNSMAWDITALGKTLIDIVGGKSVGGEQRQITVGEKAVLKISAVTTGIFNALEYKVVESSEVPETLVHPLKGNLLFSRANTRDLVGATCIVDDDYEYLFLPDKIWRLDLQSNMVSNWYLRFLLTHEGFRENLRKVATGTSGSMLNISKAKLKQLKIPLPPIELQNQFAERILAIEAQKLLALASLEKSAALFNSLLQRAFKGELTD
jgi:type I restriction enzyme, S subunit